MASNILSSLAALTVPVTNLEHLQKNPRRGDVAAVARSYKRFGQRKPIVARRTGENEDGPTGTVLAGNHQLAAAISLGWDSIAVVFVDDDEATAQAYALADNRTAELGGFDEVLLAEVLSELEAADASLLEAASYSDLLINGAAEDRTAAEEDSDNLYTDEVNVPQYTPTGEKPAVSKLYEDSKAEQLKTAIQKSNLPKELEDFLLAAANRHTVFNYRNIAEYYAHAPADVQRLFEDSALVIIDLDDAIARGYVRFTDTEKALRETAKPNKRIKTKETSSDA